MSSQICGCGVFSVFDDCGLYMVPSGAVVCAVFITSLMRQPHLCGCGNVLIKLTVVKYQSTWLLNFVFGCYWLYVLLSDTVNSGNTIICENGRRQHAFLLSLKDLKHLNVKQC